MEALADRADRRHVLEREIRAGRRAPRDWLALVDAARRERIRFAMALSITATDTMLAGADPVAGTRWKTGPAFLGDLSTLFRDVSLGQREPVSAP
ncbi:hypothetical protein [Variovorax paradoxus]|uniref:hypothetical protein n=1 Tax=Variovorax paradoxus TaxID=34073 RepID=UPI003D65F1B7